MHEWQPQEVSDMSDPSLNHWLPLDRSIRLVLGIYLLACPALISVFMCPHLPTRWAVGLPIMLVILAVGAVAMGFFAGRAEVYGQWADVEWRVLERRADETSDAEAGERE